jgi:hypothetical protein
VLAGSRLPGIVTRTAARFSRIIVAIAGVTVRQPQVVVAIEIPIGIAPSSAIKAIVGTRVVAARIEIHIATLCG